MAKTILNQAGIIEIEKSQPDATQRLRFIIKDIDSLAQGAFSEIASFASAALFSLEQPNTYLRGFAMDDIANFLNAIKDRAQTTEDSINSLAEEVGSNYVDEAQRKRWGAKQAADEINRAEAAALTQSLAS